MTPVHVYSGNIKDTFNFEPDSLFQFNIEDNAMGLIDSITNCNYNALYDYNNFVYIYEDNSLPAVRNTNLYNSLRNATWVPLNPYVLKNDAETRVFAYDFTIHVREAGKYPISEATVQGKKVYRYRDTYYIEDYKNFLRHHEYQRPPFTGEKPIELIRGIAGQGYVTRVGASGLPILTSNGRIVYTTGLITAPDSTDKIYFEKPGQAVNYRLRHIYHSKEERQQIDEFYTNGRVKDRYLRRMVDEQGFLIGEGLNDGKEKTFIGFQANKDNPLFVKLNEINDKHLEKMITGYIKCSNPVRFGGSKSVNFKVLFKTNDDRDIDSPPLPVTGNGY